MSDEAKGQPQAQARAVLEDARIQEDLQYMGSGFGPPHPAVGLKPVTAGQLLPGGSGWVNPAHLHRDGEGGLAVAADAPVTLTRPFDGPGVRLHRESHGFAADLTHAGEIRPTDAPVGALTIPARDATHVPPADPQPETPSES